MIDFTKTGKYPVRIKIVHWIAPQQGGKVGSIKIEGCDQPIKYWASTKFTTPIALGAEDEAEIEVKPDNYRNDGSNEAFLLRFGAASAKTGGGRTYAPREFYAELAPSIGGIYQRCIDKGMDPANTEHFAESYAKVMKGIRDKT